MLNYGCKSKESKGDNNQDQTAKDFPKLMKDSLRFRISKESQAVQLKKKSISKYIIVQLQNNTKR
jgi:hypothetical protein